MPSDASRGWLQAGAALRRCASDGAPPSWHDAPLHSAGGALNRFLFIKSERVGGVCYRVCNPGGDEGPPLVIELDTSGEALLELVGTVD